MKSLECCTTCPRECGVNRLEPFHKKGFCNTGGGFPISSVTVHKGEEPVISGENGICNVFFAHCNMKCIYCQNYRISRNKSPISREWTLDEVVAAITALLDTGIENVGFVTPSHVVPQVKAIINELHRKGYFPIVVYNTNGYEKVETLRGLENFIDVYLPDFKYSDSALAGKWSGAKGYPEVAGAAIKEMVRQKGNTLFVNGNGKAERGIIIRHLVLPGAVENSIGVLRFLSHELSSRITLSLMSQYTPVEPVAAIEPLNRKITAEEYEKIVAEMDNLGFTNGWVQAPESSGYYLPDFNSQFPFQETEINDTGNSILP